MIRFEVQTYKPDGGFNPVRLPVLIVPLLAAAVGLGWLASFVGQWFYLILLFPAGIGLGLGFLGAFAGRLAKMRNAGFGALTGLLTGVLAVASMHYFDYQRFLGDREELRAVIGMAGGQRLAPAEWNQIVGVGKDLERMNAVRNFWDFMNFEAETGVQIASRPGREGFNLGFIGSWIYWLLELGFVAFLAFAGVMVGVMKPYCTMCDTWKERRKLGTLRSPDPDGAVAALKEGDLARLAAEHAPAPEGGELEVNAAVCTSCGPAVPIVVKLERVTKNKKGETERKDLVELTYPGEALAVFEAIFASGALSQGQA